MSQRFSPGFFGPAMALPRRRLPQRWKRGVSPVRLPAAAKRQLAAIAGAVGRAGGAPPRRAIAELERTLLQRATFGPHALDAERIAAIGYDAWLDEQLDYEALDDSELEDALSAALPTLSLSASELYRLYNGNPFVPVLELWTAAVFRAAYSPRQLYERMVVFWTDHFNIDIAAEYQYMLKPVDDREVVRAHALGDFADLVAASAHSPAMLVYLTNDTNEKNHPNENYARELLELHTMGADNGYSEEDVKEVARCFTGWTWIPPFSNLGVAGTFRFSSFLHDFRAKRVLKRSISAGGEIEDGERVLKILAKRSETAGYVATKLLRYLWGYEPTAKDIAKVRRAYHNSGGDLRDTVRAALSSERLATATPKLKRPFHLMVSAVRALGGEMANANGVLDNLAGAGHLPFGWPPPDGYPDDPTYWSGFLMPRFNFAGTLFDTERGGTLTVDPSVDDPSGTRAEIVDRLDTMLVDGRMSDSTRDAVVAYLGKGKTSRRRVRTAIGLVVASPEFQEY